MISSIQSKTIVFYINSMSLFKSLRPLIYALKFFCFWIKKYNSLTTML